MRKKFWAGLATGLLFMTILFLFPMISSATPLNSLFAGGTYQFGNLKLSDWSLVKNEHVNIAPIEIGDTGPYSASGFGIWDYEKPWNVYGVKDALLDQIGYGPKTIIFDYMVTGIGVDICQVYTRLGAGGYAGYLGGSKPWVKATIAVGTTKGSNDLGETIDYITAGSSTRSNWLSIPTGLNQIWVRNAISLNARNADDVWLGGVRGGKIYPAVLNEFKTVASAPSPVPEPATMLLFGTGLAGLAGLNVTRKKKLQE